MEIEQSGRSAVVDIGSNSVRMVAFDRGARSLEPVFNEKALSGLGKDLLATGRLDPEGRVSALAILKRFSRIAADLDVDRVRAVATAAARAAEDGPEFVAAAEAELGWPIEVLSGTEEARLSALGVICGVPEADGVIGDLGGGSLEIADVRDGGVEGPVSLPLGPLALGELVGRRDEKGNTREILAALPAGLAKGRALYAVGGAWRGLAKHYFVANRYPIRIIHQFELDAKAAHGFAGRIGGLKPDGLGALKGISARRRPNAPFAARLLGQLIERLEPRCVIFSGYGLREGLEFERMPIKVRAEDPLIAHSRELGAVGARIPFDGDALANWALGAFETPPAARRLVRAAAWLSDISGADHPDYRGYHAAQRAMHLSTVALSHQDRVFLAAAVYARYSGFGMESALGKAVEMIDEAARRNATALGMALRLAHAIQPGDAADGDEGLRAQFRLKRAGDVLFLETQDVAPEVLGETARRRLASLARALDVEAKVVARQSAAA